MTHDIKLQNESFCPPSCFDFVNFFTISHQHQKLLLNFGNILEDLPVYAFIFVVLVEVHPKKLTVGTAWNAILYRVLQYISNYCIWCWYIGFPFLTSVVCMTYVCKALLYLNYLWHYEFFVFLIVPCACLKLTILVISI